MISKGDFSRLIFGASSCFRAMNMVRSSATYSPTSARLLEDADLLPEGPFTGLVICVTGLSKEARTEVVTATERLGGRYSASLHPQCTHLVVQSFTGQKFEHALKHGPKNGLLIVTLGWFVDSVRRNARLNESLYSVKSAGDSGLSLEDLNRFVRLPGNEKSCLPVTVFQEETDPKSYCQLFRTSRKEITSGLLFSNDVIFIDVDVPSELKKKVAESTRKEGAKLLDEWFVGCDASHVVCEGPSLHRYIGHANRLVTPSWILKTAATKGLQRLVHLSSDLARQAKTILESAQKEESCDAIVHPAPLRSRKSNVQIRIKCSLEDRKKAAHFAKLCVKNRRSDRLRSYEFPIHPIIHSSLLESVSWSICEPPLSACVHTESSSTEDASDKNSCDMGEFRDDCRDDLLRPLRESEKQEIVFKNHFLTILFPIDRFDELGPSSRTFFSNCGFSCIQLLEHIYQFYQMVMSEEEIEVAIHTDSRPANRLRSLYASKESAEQGFVSFKRMYLLGSRRNFNALKRVNGDNNSNVYELIIKA